MTDRFEHYKQQLKVRYSLAEYSERRAHDDRWVAAFYAHRVVGLNKDGLTRQLARQIKKFNPTTGTWESVSVDLVENLAHAYEMFIFLCQFGFRMARNLRNRYSTSRFAALYHAWKTYEPEPERLISALESETSIKGMMALIIDAEHPLTEWERDSLRTTEMLHRVINSYDAPQYIKDAFQNVLDVMERWEEEKGVRVVLELQEPA